MKNKFRYILLSSLVILSLIACELFESGYGEKVDLSDPVMSISSPVSGSYVSGTFRLQGSATDDTSVKKVEIQFLNHKTGSAETVEALLDGETWYLDIDTDSDKFADGETEFIATVTDSADKTANKTTLVYIDNSNPTVLVSSPSAQDMEIVNGTLVIKGEVDDQKLDRVEVYIVSVDDDTEKYGGVADGTSSWKYEVDTLSLGLGVEEEESFYLEVKAYDDAGNSNEYFYFNDDLQSVRDVLGVNTVTLDDLSDTNNRNLLTNIQRDSSQRLVLNVNQFQNTPQIDLGNDWDLTNEDNLRLFPSGNSLTFTIIDDDGLDSVVLSIYSANGTLLREGVKTVGGSRSYNFTVPIESDVWGDGFDMITNLEGNLPEGSYYMEIIATDVEGAASGVGELPYPANFVIDITNPILTVTGYEGVVYRDGDFIINGTVSDTLVLGDNPISVNVTRNGESIVVADPVITNVDGVTKNWSQLVSVTDHFDNVQDGTYNIIISASDAVGRTVNSIKTVVVDTLGPNLGGISLSDDELILGNSVTVTGIASDTLNLSYVEYSLDSGVNWLRATGNATWSIPLAGLTDTLDAELQVRAVDNAGNYSETLIIPFRVDTDLPELTETAINSLSVFSSNDHVVLSGSISDGNGIESFTVSVNGAPSESVIIAGDDTWTYTVLNTTEGSFELDFTATDGAGRITSLRRNILIDTTSPVLVVSAPVDNELVDSNSFTLRGQVTDNSGIGVTSLEYSRDGESWTSISLAGLNWTVTGVDFETPVGAEADQGARTLYVRATDGLNAYTTESINFNFDINAPVLTEVTLPDDSQLITATNVVFSGVASDSNELLSLVVSVNGADATNITVNDDNTWSYSIPGITDGSYTLIFTALDAAGRTTGIERNILMDTTSPVTPGIDEIAGDYVIDELSITGVTSDLTSGIDTVEYSLNNIDWYSVNGSTNWFKTIDVSEVTEGPGSVWVRSTDRAGNVSLPSSETYIIDRENPILIENVVSTESEIISKTDVVFSGTVTDSNAIISLVVSINDVEADLTDLIDGNDNDISTLDDNSDSWSFTLPFTVDGTYEVVFKATDLVGRISKVNRNVLMDTTAPSTPVLTSQFSNYETTSISITGTASDNVTDGVAKVEYSFDNSTWTLVSGTDSWSKTVNISAQVDGTKTLYLRATDRAGNISPVAEETFVKDNVDPEIVINGYVEPVYRSSDFTITGTIVDNLDLGDSPLTFLVELDPADELADHIDVDLNSYITSYTGSGISKDFSQVIPVSSGEGIYEVIITGEDAVGRPVSITKSVTVDAQQPTLTVDNLVDNQLITGSSYSISGTATEVGVSGLDYVEYSVDGGTTWTEAYTTNLWLDWTINLIGLEDTLNGDFRVRAFDKAGNSSVIEEITFKVSTANPESTITGLASTFNYVNSEVSISGLASDLNGIKTVTASYKLDGGSDTNLTIGGTLPNWSTTLPTTEGVYDVTIVVTDNTDQTNIYTRSVAIDTSVPDLAITAPISSTIVSNNSYEIRGTVTDNGGKGVTELQYSRNNTDWTDISISGLQWSAIVDFSTFEAPETVQGSRSIYVRASDGLNSDVVEVVNFNFDTADPELDVNATVNFYDDFSNTFSDINLDSESEVVTASVVALTGTVSDTNELAAFSLVINDTEIMFNDAGIEDVSGIKTLFDFIDSGDNSWSYTLPNTTDGAFELIFTATDVAGRNTIIERNILIDATAPVTPTIDAVAGDYVVNSFSLSGDTSDLTSGVGSVEYSLDYTDDSNDLNDTWVAVNGTDNWFKTVDVTAESEGTNAVYVRSIDRAGNVSTVATSSYTKDINNPEITVVGYDGTTYKSSNFTISGTVSDTLPLGLTPVTITVTKGLNNVTLTDAIDITGTGTSKSWSQIVPITDGDGTYNVYIEASDLVGREVSITKTVIVDTIAPELSNISLVDGTLVLSDSLTITGNAYDSESLQDVSYTLDGGTTWVLAAGTDSWSIGLSGLTDSLSNTIQVKATDNAGKSVSSSVINFKVDTSLPVTTITGVAETLENVNTAVTLSGIASDNNGVKSLVVTASVDSAPLYDVIPSTLNAGGDWSINTAITTEGSYDFRIEVADETDRSQTYTRKVVIDSSAPTNTITYPTTLINGTSDTIKGSADDNNSIDTIQIAYDSDDDGVDELYDVTGNKYNWSYDIDFAAMLLDKYISYGETWNIGGEDVVIDVYKIPYKVYLTDYAGNTTTTVSELVIYPDGDLPIVNIEAPTNFTLTSGVINVIGSTYDDDGAVDLEVQIDLNGDGDLIDTIDFDSSGLIDVDYENENVPVVIENAGSWSFKLNEGSELYASNIGNGATGEIVIYITPVDINGKYGVTKEVYVTLDNSGPSIGDIALTQGAESLIDEDNRTRSVGGTFNISSAITDTIGLSDIKYSFDGGISSVSYQTYTAPDTITADNKDAVYLGLGKSVTFDYDVDTTVEADILSQLTDGAGDIIFQLLAYDTTQLQIGKSLRLSIDNEKPSINFTTSTYSEIAQSGSNKKLIFGGNAYDTNKIDRVEIFLVSGSNSISFANGAVDGNNITNPTGDYLLTIDDYYAKGTDLDGDGFYESWTESGNSLEWYTEMVSVPESFPTDFEIHYTIYDEAGNTEVGIAAPIIVGTDIDGNDAISDGEKVNYIDNMRVVNSLSIGVNYSDTAGKSMTVTPQGTDVVLNAALSTDFNKVYTINNGYTGNILFDVEITTGSSTVSKTLVVEAISGSGSAPTIEFTGEYEVVEGEGHVDGTNLSGKIRFYGTAYDDIWLKQIKDGDTVIARWGESGFEGVDGLGVTIISESSDWNNGHTVEWSYEVDTPSPQTNYSIDLTAVDSGDQTGTDTSNLYTVVPYITGIVNSLSTAYPYTPSGVARTANGHYPVKLGDEITISGYNFDSTASVNIGAYTIDSADVTGSTGAIVITVPDTASGELSVSMGGVSSVNNSNDNSLETNQEPNNFNNNLLTDDRVLDIWNITTIDDTLGAEYPYMSLDTSNNVSFSYSVSNLFKILSGTISGGHYSPVLWSSASMPYSYTALDLDDSNNIVGFAVGSQYASGGTDHTELYFKEPATAAAGHTEQGWRRVLEPPVITIDSVEYSSTTRSQNPTLIVKGDIETTGGMNKIYLTYYDDITKELRFRYSMDVDFTSDWSKADNESIGLQTYKITEDTKGYHVIADSTSSSNSVSMDVASDGTVYVAWFDETSKSLKLKYNTSISTLERSIGALEASSNSTTWSDIIEVTATDSNAGHNVAIKVDSTGGLHLAYKNVVPGFPELEYAFISNVKTTPVINTYTIDQTLSTGDNIDMSLIYSEIDTDDDGMTDTTIVKPYISYFNSTFRDSNSSLRVAYPAADIVESYKTNGAEDNLYTGNWEISALPTTDVPEYYKLSVRVKTDGTPVIGYTTDAGLQYAVKN